MFGKKQASEFDVTQDASLKRHDKSITSIVAWCNAANKHFEALYSQTSQLSTSLKQLDKTLSALVTEHNKQVTLNEDQEKRLKTLEKAEASS
jgi:septal ring factor EnvC (AmiA/AmiB activator)